MTNEERQALIAQGWTPPPEPVDPDLAEAQKLHEGWEDGAIDEVIDVALAGIKRGRALALSEAKPGVVWVKHDGSKVCPIVGEVLARYDNGYFTANVAEYIHWPLVTHYAIITQPEEK